MISASAEVALPHVVDNHYIVHCDTTPGTDLDIVRPLCQYVWGSLRYRVCNFQLFRWEVNHIIVLVKTNKHI